MAIPPGAVYVSEDGLVTFDQYGRKLDSLGNVAWDDTQGAWGANAKPIERPQMQQQPQAQQAATPIVKAATGAYSPSVSATPQQSAAAQQRSPTPSFLQPAEEQRRRWDNERAAYRYRNTSAGSVASQNTPYIPGMTGYAPPSQAQTGQVASPPYVPQPVVDPWSVAPGAPYNPAGAGGYPNNIKTEAQRMAANFDDGTLPRGYGGAPPPPAPGRPVSPYPPSGGYPPPVPGQGGRLTEEQIQADLARSSAPGWTNPEEERMRAAEFRRSAYGWRSPAPGGREYWERGGRGPFQEGIDMMRFKHDEMAWPDGGGILTPEQMRADEFRNSVSGWRNSVGESSPWNTPQPNPYATGGAVSWNAPQPNPYATQQGFPYLPEDLIY